MNRETLKKIERFLTFGDIKQKEDETGCYHITDKAMQKVISGYEEELLTLKRKLVEERIDYRRETAGQVESEVSDDFGENEQLRDTLTIIYQLAQKGKTLGWEFDRKTKGAYNFNIKLDVSEYDS